MVDRAMMTLIALVNRAMKKKPEEREREEKRGEEDDDEQEKEDAKLRVDRQMGNEIIRLLFSPRALSLSLLSVALSECMR